MVHLHPLMVAAIYHRMGKDHLHLLMDMHHPPEGTHHLEDNTPQAIVNLHLRVDMDILHHLHMHNHRRHQFIRLLLKCNHHRLTHLLHLHTYNQHHHHLHVDINHNHPLIDMHHLLIDMHHLLINLHP